jgi:hydroxypyruvate reductase
MPALGTDSGRSLPKVLIHGAHLERLRRDWAGRYEFHLLRDFADLHSFLNGVGADIEVIISDGNAIPAQLLAEMPRLRLVACFSTGYLGIDTAALRARGIALTTAAGVNAHDVADHATALALGVWHGLVLADASVRAGQWRDALQPRRSLRGRNAGIVGLGRIGSAIAARAVALGLSVEWYGPNAKLAVPYARIASLTELAARADILFVSGRATEETRHLVGERELEALGREGILVSVSRGSLVDEDALIRCLRDGRLGGAGLDVFEEEPTPPSRWLDVPGLTLSPHIGGYTREAGPAMMERLAENVRRYFAGEPLLTPAW